MKYRVVFAESFVRDVDDQIAYWRAQRVSDDVVESWFARLFNVVDHLASMPHMFAVDELQSRAVGREARKLTVGDYLVFYIVDEEAKLVSVVAFVHGAMKRDDTHERE